MQLLNKISYKSLLLPKLLFFLFLSFIAKAQTITCPADSNLGTFDCNTIVEVPIQVNSIEAALEIYGIEITGALPQTRVTTIDSDIIFYCESNAREVIREVIIYNDNFNLQYDEGEEIAICTFIIQMEPDLTAPVFSIPPDTTITCEDAADLSIKHMFPPLIMSTDNCTDLNRDFVHFSETRIPEKCGVTVLRSWVATDACGNTSEPQIQTLFVKEVTGPEFTVPVDITVACGADITDENITGTVTEEFVDCKGITVIATGTIVDELTQFNTPCAGSTIYTKRWVAEDSFCNVTIKDQLILMECPAGCSNQDICAGDIVSDPLPGDCKCQVIEEQILGCTNPADTNYNAAANCEDGSCSTNDPLIICPAETNLGTFNCGTIAEIPNQVNTLEEAIAAPYNIEITGIQPKTRIVTEDSDFIFHCESNAREIIRSITIYNDNNNNFAYDIGEEIETCMFTITIEPDLEAPQFFTLDIETTCEEGLPYSFHVQKGLVADDNCPGYTAEYVDYSEAPPVTGACPGELVIVRSWTTTDLCGNARDHTQTVTIKDVTGPEFTVPADITVPCGTDLMDTLVTGNAANGFDECEGVEVAVIATIMDELTQENMPCSGSNSYIKRWKAVDGCNNVTTKDQIIVVDCDDSNCIDALLFTAPRDTKTSCEFGYGMEVTGEPELSSNLCPTLSYEVTFTDNFADPICEGGDIIISRSWVVSDACGNESEAQTQNIVVEGTPPEFTVPPDIIVPCGTDPMDDTVTGAVTDGTDECGSFEVEVIAVIADDLTQENTPCPGYTTYTKRWGAVDGCGTATVKDQIIVVDCSDEDCSTEIPTITCPSETNLTLTCDMINNPDFPQIQVVPDGLEAIMLPPYNIEITGISSQTSLFVEDSDTISFCASGAREVTRLVTIYNDENLNFAYNVGEEIGSCTYTILIEAIIDAPIFTAPPDIQSSCELGSGVEVTGEPILSPNACPSLSYNISFIDIPAISECYGETLIFRNWTVTDACGNQNELTQEIYLFDNEGPLLTIPADITVPCGSNPMDNSITGDISYAYDVCEDAELETYSIIIFDLTQEDTPCPGSTTYTKRWAAVDGCGNATTKDQIIVAECPPDCSNQDICVGDIVTDPLPGECDCQIVEEQVLGCLDPRCINFDPNVNCDDGSCLKDFDLALVKELTSTGPITIGANTSITFTITIYNQGDIAAQNIEVVDYLPAGLILNDTNWIQSGANAVFIFAGPLSPGASISVDISFTIDSSTTPDTYTNYAEIFGAQDILGNPGQDSDSTPDMNNGNDYFNSDLYSGNEDDHDGVEFTLVENEPCANNNAGYFCE